MSLLRAFVKGSLCFVIGTQSSQIHAISAEALEFKCATSKKTSVTSQLEALKISKPTEASAIASCVSSVSSTYKACVKTIDTAVATGGGAAAANTNGQQKQFQAQKNVAGVTSQLSQGDMVANQACSKSAKSSQSSCSKYSIAKGYLSEIEAKCNVDAQTAASNTQNLDQLESADEELAGNNTPPMMPQSPAAAAPAQTTPPELSEYTPDTTDVGSSSSSSAPNFVPPIFPDFNTAARSLLDAENTQEKEPTYSAGSFPAFSEAYKELTGKEPSPEEVESFVASTSPSGMSGGSSGSLLGSGSAGSATGSGVAKNKADSEALSEGVSGGGGFNSGGGLSLASFNPNAPDLTAGPGLVLPTGDQENISTDLPGIPNSLAVPSKNKKTVAGASPTTRAKIIPQRNGKLLYKTASIGSLDSSSDDENGNSRGLAVTVFFAALSAAGFAIRKFRTA